MYKFVVVSAILAGQALVGQALAQGYPAKPIRYVVPFPPGAFNDTLGRTIAQKFTEGGFAQTVVDNRPGAGSTIGTDIVAKAPPDGYTVLGVAVPFAVNASLYARLPFDTVRDFTGVIYAGATPNMLVMHPSVPVSSIKELIGAARTQPNKVTYSSAGNASNLHVAVELFNVLTGVRMLHIPYKGGGPALTAVLGGEADLSVLAVSAVQPYIDSGRLRALGITSVKRMSMLPQMPTVAEEIAKLKMPDLTAADLEAAIRTIAGSARSMGVDVVEG